MLGCIMLLNWQKIRGLMNVGIYNALKLIEYHKLVDGFIIDLSEIRTLVKVLHC